MVNEPYKNTRSINLWTSKWKSLKRCSFHIKMNLYRGDRQEWPEGAATTRYEWFIFRTRWKSQFLPLMCRPPDWCWVHSKPGRTTSAPHRLLFIDSSALLGLLARLSKVVNSKESLYTFYSAQISWWKY